MPVYVIDTLKPKNGLDFPVVESVDVAVEGYSSLADAVTHFATDVAISALTAALDGKADKTTTNSLQAQIDQIAQAAGTGSADTEVAQARVDYEGISHPTLKSRIDADRAKAIDENAEIYTDLSEIRDKYEPINLFNKSDARIIDSKYIAGNTMETLNSASISHPIYLKSGKTYTFTTSEVFGSLNSRIIHPINENGSALTGDALYATANENNSATITITTSGYYAFNLRKSAIGTVMFVEGTSLPQSYSAYFTPYSIIKESALPDLGLDQIEINTEEITQARVGVDRTNYQTLKARLDAENAFTNQNIEDNRYEIDSDLNEIRDKYEPVNIFNKNDARIIDGSHITGNDITPLEGASISHPIYLKKNITYTFTTNSFFGSLNSRILHPIEEDGSELTGSAIYADDNGDDTATITITVSGYYAFNVRTPGKALAMFVEGTTLPSAYSAYFTPYSAIKESALPDLGIDQIENDVETNTSNISSINTDLDEIRTKYEPINIFNKSDSRITTGKYLVGNTTADLNGSCISHPIYLTAGKSYTFKTNSVFFGPTNCRILHPIKEDGSELTGSAIYAIMNEDESATIAIQASDYYAFNFKESENSIVMFVEGTELPSTYQKYFEPYTSINEEVLPHTDPENILTGKSVSWTGDSICYGAGYAGGYGKIIADRNSMESYNIAVSGGTIRNIVGHFYIGGSIADMAISDYNILEGGVNDASLHSSGALGSITQDYQCNFDTSTFYGAFEKMLSDALIKFKGKKLGYIIVHSCVLRFSSWWTADNGYYEAVKKCCMKWGVPFLDLSSAVPPFGLLTTGNDELKVLPNTYTNNGDGWHPNEAGYEKYYCDKIEEWMKTL